MYGKEHSAIRTNALRHLLKEHRDHPDFLSLAGLMGVWEELTWRWWEELRRELAAMEAELGQHPPALPELTAYATAPDGRGGTRLKLPRTFVVEDPAEHYLRVIAPRLQRVRPPASGPTGGGRASGSRECPADLEAARRARAYSIAPSGAPSDDRQPIRGGGRPPFAEPASHQFYAYQPRTGGAPGSPWGADVDLRGDEGDAAGTPPPQDLSKWDAALSPLSDGGEEEALGEPRPITGSAEHCHGSAGAVPPPSPRPSARLG